MPKENRNILKSYFESGDKPNQMQFASLIDSTVNNIEDKANSQDIEIGTDNEKYVTPSGIRSAIENFSPVRTVNGITPVNGNVTIENGNPTDFGNYQTGIASFFTSETSYTKIFHLKLPYKLSAVDAMYFIKILGHAFASIEIIDITYVGYCYATINSLSYTKNHIVGSTTISAGEYVGSDNHIYLWFKVPNTYYTTFKVDSMLIGNGYPICAGDVEIIFSEQTTL